MMCKDSTFLYSMKRFDEWQKEKQWLSLDRVHFLQTCIQGVGAVERCICLCLKRSAYILVRNG